MAMTLRLPEALRLEAQAHAATLGLSINALVALALRDYLDAPRRTRPSGRSSVAPVQAAALMPSAQTALSPPLKSIKAPASRNEPCPCGALNPQGYPLKWKHCHGRATP